ncbi:MAG: phosphatase PAP2 family protein [Acutalibacteraceae bacterium]
MGLSRMIAGAHYLTDVVFGAIVGYTAVLAVSLVLRKAQERIESRKI